MAYRSISEIITACSKVTRIPRHRIVSRVINTELVAARRAISIVARERELSFDRIGAALDRDHATIRYLVHGRSDRHGDMRMGAALLIAAKLRERLATPTWWDKLMEDRNDRPAA